MVDIVDKLKVIKVLISENYPTKEINDGVIDEAIAEIEYLRGINILNSREIKHGENKG